MLKESSSVATPESVKDRIVSTLKGMREITDATVDAVSASLTGRPMIVADELEADWTRVDAFHSRWRRTNFRN